jgi:translation initiation factor IF-1
MQKDFIIAIVKIKELVVSGLYLAEDVFDGSEIKVSVTGKMRMIVFPPLQPEDECVIQISPYDTSRGRIVTKTSLKGDNGVYGGYLDVRKRYEAEFGPYSDDFTLIKRAA